MTTIYIFIKLKIETIHSVIFFLILFELEIFQNLSLYFILRTNVAHLYF
jgi:hypothetical protein